MRVAIVTIILPFTLLASSQEVATLTDIKESLYYLIQDYNNLVKRVERLETRQQPIDKKPCSRSKARKIIKDFIESEELR